MAADHSQVVVYTLSGCVHCSRARALLRRHEIPFREICGDGEPGFRQHLRSETGDSTVPQVVIGGTPAGGASDLARLARGGLLVPLARGERFPRAIVRRRVSVSGLLAVPFGGTCGVRRYRVDWVERDGRVLERLRVRSAAEAQELAVFLNEREVAA